MIQDEQGEGLGGIFGGGSSTPFGSRAGNVLTRFTTIFAILFLFGSFMLAWMNRTKESDIPKPETTQEEEVNFFAPDEIIEELPIETSEELIFDDLESKETEDTEEIPTSEVSEEDDTEVPDVIPDESIDELDDSSSEESIEQPADESSETESK